MIKTKAVALGDGVQQICQGQKTVGIERVADARALDLRHDDSGRAEDAQMFGNGRLGQPHLFNNFAADTGLLFEQQTYDVDTRGMTERLGDGGESFLVYHSIGQSRRATEDDFSPERMVLSLISSFDD